MELFAAAVLGTVQGLTEFLPVSSSAHLILVPWLLGWKPEGLLFDVSLHMGTALAILAYFWSDWIRMAQEVIKGVVQGRPLGNPDRRLAWFLVVGTLPALLVGLAFEKRVEATLRSPLVTVATLVLFGAALYYAELLGRQTRTLEEFTWADSIYIGLSQAVALIPGVSRSGVTITTGLLRNSQRIAAARFSFLLSTPVIVGAGLLECWHLVRALRQPAMNASDPLLAGTIQWEVLAVGVFFAAVTGFLSIRYFLRYIQSRSLRPFVIYRFVLAAIVLMYYLRLNV